MTGGVSNITPQDRVPHDLSVARTPPREAEARTSGTVPRRGRLIRGLRLAVAILPMALACTEKCSPRAVGPASEDLIVNGSFETPEVARGGYQLFAAGTSFAGWRVIGAPGNVAPISGEYRSGALTFQASHGKQWLDLTGLSNSATGVEQSVPTVPHATYDLHFDVGNVVGAPFGTTSAVEITIDGRSVGVAHNDAGAGTNRQAWRTFSLSFVAAGSTTIIGFVNRDDGSDNSNGLDHVTLRQGSGPPTGIVPIALSQ
jgi:hypothetical protein